MLREGQHEDISFGVFEKREPANYEISVNAATAAAASSNGHGNERGACF